MTLMVFKKGAGYEKRDFYPEIALGFRYRMDV
jgi:hypothetical protein